MNRKNSADKPGIRLIGFLLAVLLVFTMTGCSPQKDADTTTETEPTVTVTAPQEESTSAPPVSVTEDIDAKMHYDDVSYEELMANLNENVKRFDPDLQAYVKDIVSIAYQNAGELCSALQATGIPKKEILLNEKVVKSLGKIDRLLVVTEMEDDYSALREKYETSRYVQDENAIYVFITGWNRTEQVQILLEELVHAGQDYALDANIDFSATEILTEGEANLYAWAMGFGNINNDALDFMRFRKSEDDLFQLYGAGYHDHAAASKYYIYLLSLVGYNVMNYLKYNEADLKTVTDRITQLYGVDGERFLELMCLVIVDLATNIEDMRTDMMLEVEKIYNECLLQKVEKLSSKEEIEAFLKLYRFINIQFGTRHLVQDQETDTYTDETAKDASLSRENIDSALFEKVSACGLLEDMVSGLPDDQTTQKQIFDMIVDSPRPEDYGDNYYSIDISASRIRYAPADRSLTIENQNGSHCRISLNKGTVTGEPYVIDFSTQK